MLLALLLVGVGIKVYNTTSYKDYFNNNTITFPNITSNNDNNQYIDDKYIFKEPNNIELTSYKNISSSPNSDTSVNTSIITKLKDNPNNIDNTNKICDVTKEACNAMDKILNIGKKYKDNNLVPTKSELLETEIRQEAFTNTIKEQRKMKLSNNLATKYSSERDGYSNN